MRVGPCMSKQILTILSQPMCLCLCLDPVSLEREVVELRSQLRAATVRNETQELKKTLEHKDKERVHLSLQVEVRVSGSVS